MHPVPSRLAPAARRILCVIGLLALAGCREDEITHAVVPRAAEPEKTRLFGVIYPHGDQTWFFKLTGPESAVDDGVKKTFNDFLESVRLTDKADPPIAWTVPEGWKQVEGPKARYATFRLGSKEKPLELTVTMLGKEAASILDNVNRWRGQLGLEKVDKDELKKIQNDFTLNGDPVVSVDLIGSLKGKKPVMGPAWTYQKPDDWTESPHPEAGPVRREAVFRIVDGDKEAEVSVTALGGPAGGLMPNVTRWCNQIDAPPVPPDQVDKAPTINVAGRAARYLDLTGAKGRLLGVVVPRDDQTWFFKMKGPADLVEKQKPSFEAFLKSVKFAGQGATNE